MSNAIAVVKAWADLTTVKILAYNEQITPEIKTMLIIIKEINIAVVKTVVIEYLT